MQLRSAVLASLLVLCSQARADIPDIDSSEWSTDPRDYGMSPGEYIQSESRAFFHDFLSRSGLNRFYHFQGLTNAADRWVVSPNNDTIYSITVVNASQGFTLKLPDVGERFISAQIITENHMTPFYIYGGGVHSFSADDFDTRFVGVGIRIGTDGSTEDVKKVIETLQPQYTIEGAANDDSLPPVDMAILKQVREAMIAEYSKLADSFDTMVKRTEDVKDWERFTYVTAGAWGLSADENAMYAIGGPTNAEGGACYTASFSKVPAKAFFSITVYGPEKYLMTDEHNIVSSNRGIKLKEDGSFDVAFGDKQCRQQADNYVATPEDGWSFLLRAYRPDVKAFNAYELPEITRVE